MSGLGAGRQHFCCICVRTLKHELSKLEQENRILRKNLPKSVMRRLVIQKAIEDI